MPARALLGTAYRVAPANCQGRQLLKTIRHTFTRVISGLESVLYEEQLNTIDLHLMGRRISRAGPEETVKWPKELFSTDRIHNSPATAYGRKLVRTKVSGSLITYFCV